MSIPRNDRILPRIVATRLERDKHPVTQLPRRLAAVFAPGAPVRFRSGAATRPPCSHPRSPR